MTALSRLLPASLPVAVSGSKPPEQSIVATVGGTCRKCAKARRGLEAFNKPHSWRGATMLNSGAGTRHVMGKGVKPDTSYRLSEPSVVQLDGIF